MIPALGRRLRAWLAQLSGVLSEVDGDAVEPGARPDDLARGAEDVEVGGAIALHAPRKDVALPQGDGERERLEGDERLAERLAPTDSVPGGEKTAERRLLGGLDLPSEHRERRPPDASQDIGIAPLALAAAGTQLAANEPVRPLELLELDLDPAGREAEARGHLVRCERAARARMAGENGAERVLDRLEEGGRHPAGRDDPERVAEEPRILGCGGELPRGETNADRASLADEGLREARVELLGCERARAPQEIVELVGVPRCGA